MKAKKKIHDLDRFRGNGPYGKFPTEKEPITTLGFTLPYNNKEYPPKYYQGMGIFTPGEQQNTEYL